jgi:S-DNA-T family DNA segregation ATPase FtsK/SpoIIIE
MKNATTVDDLLAITAFRIIENQFRSLDIGERKCFKLANFKQRETLSFIKICEESATGQLLEDVKIVVASDVPETIPERYRADGTITTYRNRIEAGHGLIYIEASTQSDSQGLQNIFTLRDSNFLDGSFDTNKYSVPEQIVISAIEQVFGKNEQSQNNLTSRCTEVLLGLKKGGVAISVRKYVAFTLEVVLSRFQLKEAVDSLKIDAMVGENLLELDLFADANWAAGLTQAQSSRRLANNFLHSELASSASSDLDQDKLADLCRTLVFKDADGQEFDSVDQTKWRDLCASYCQNPVAGTRANIPYCIFEQLFRRDTKGLGLGERIEQELDESDSARLVDYENLGVNDGLNKKISDEAKRFLDDEPDQTDVLALRDLISVQTRKMVNRLAYPNPEKFGNPLTKLAEVAELFRENSIAEDVGTIRLQLARQANFADCSVGLFNFLYGSSLTSIAEASVLTGFNFEVDERLCSIVAPPAVIDAGDDEEFDEEEPLSWDGVSLEFVLLDAETREEAQIEQALEWCPDGIERLALLWLTTAAKDRPDSGRRLQIPADQTVEEWVDVIVSRDSSISAYVVEENPEIASEHVVEELKRIVDSFREDACKFGLSSALLSTYYDEWNQLLEVVKNTLIPKGVENATLAAFLYFECVLSADGKSLLMLATHPLRARWISLFIRKSEDLAIKALAGELPLNSQNRNFYLNWVSDLLSSNESGWTEEFTAHTQQQSPELTENIASTSIEEIVTQLRSYLAAHPYKADGLTLIVITHTTPGFTAELARFLRNGEWKNVNLCVHLITPRSMWGRAADLFEQVPAENRLYGDNSLFPPLQLILHDIDEIENPDSSLSRIDADLAIVPQFLNDEISIQEYTAPSATEAGSFDPLLDPPTYIYGGSGGGVIRVAQRPKMPDAALLNWSTLIVRQNRMGPVAPQMPENTDLLDLVVNFQNAARLFKLLHERAHWVVTLEKYISREQIEALENKPDILTVKNGVGPGGAYTLIVSSNLGEKFIVNRLERKLAKVVSAAGHQLTKPKMLRSLAQKMYKETREIAPWLTLKAMGISRVTEEIIGLVVGRHVLELESPVICSKGICVWISLDDHQNWFGGDSGVRADLARITFEQTEDGLQVDFQVLESKLRKTSYDPHGVQQVISTLALMREIMPSDTKSIQGKVDQELWREEILIAMEAANSEAMRVFPVSEQIVDDTHRIPQEIREDFRAGRFNLRQIGGIYSICLYGQQGARVIDTVTDHPAVKVAKSYGEDLLAIVNNEWGKRGGPDPEIPVPPQVPAPVDLELGAGIKKGPSPTEITEGLPITNSAADEKIDHEVSSSMPSGKLSREELENRYQLILNTYDEFKVQVHPAQDSHERFVEGPASILFRLLPGSGVSPDRIRQHGESLKLNLKLSEEQQVRFSSGGGFMSIDVPKLPEDRYFVEANQMWNQWQKPQDELSVPLGIDRFGDIVEINFSSSNSPHLLIGGTTGSGKSEALNTILGGLVEHYSPQELRLLLIDPKGTELTHLENVEHLEGEIGFDDEDTIQLLDLAVSEMEARYKLFKQEKQRTLVGFNRQRDKTSKIPWWFIVLDEYADLTSDKDAKKAIEDRLKRLAQKARAAGIHLVIATQKPAAEVISTNLRSNLPAQLALRVKSATESRVIIDEAGAESLNGMGDAFLKSEGKLTRVQCAKV